MKAIASLWVVIVVLLHAFLSTGPVAGLSVAGNLKTRNGATRVLKQGGDDPDPVIRVKRNFIKQMLLDSWTDYRRWAWGENELKPVSQTGQTGGIYGDSKIGATIIDALDSLYIAGLEAEYKEGRDWVAANLNFSTVNVTVSLFESNIRIVGGFLSAYALTGDELFKQKAVEIADLLLPAFDSPNGIPYGDINLATGAVQKHDNSLAGCGTLHLEWVYLSEVTGNPVYKEKVMQIRKVVKAAERPKGLYYNHISPETGEYTDDKVSIGAQGDSFYEYLLKAAIQYGDTEAREMYDGAMNAFVDNDLVRISNQSHLLYIAESQNGKARDVVGHLACFAGGMFALGAHTDKSSGNSSNKARDMEIGKNFTNTCHESYTRTLTKIGPEVFSFSADHEAVAGPTDAKNYILRPEVIESYFVLYRLTGDAKYRDWGWEAATAIEKFCKAGPGRGYSGLRDVDSQNPTQDDVQQTFFLAETLKYLYLLFSSPELISLDEWVFNTECHPLPIKATNPLY